ncbi:ALG8, alpha-1,3-glucosyltransferase S-like [Pelomyxa schiedti]|nr:ALG8, alpha-1,3-glucosyltransferase S-like [Pelomyxa schiedti]
MDGLTDGCVMVACCVAVTAVKVLLMMPSYRSTDFEVHRNWMAVTYNHPVSEWYYVDQPSPWTLDYPPLFAYFEWALSFLARVIDPLLVTERSPTEAEEDILEHKLSIVGFMRFSVIATDSVLLLALYWFSKTLYQHHKQKPTVWSPSLVVFALVALNPGLLIVDHVHFQYNGLLFGILIAAFAAAASGRDLLCALLFSILLNFKHIFIYMAPAFFIYLLRHYCFTQNITGLRSLKFLNLISLGGVVSSTFIASFSMFLWDLPQVLRRLFPWGRGLCHAYWAPNFWALYNIADKILKIIYSKMGLAVVNTTALMTSGTVGTEQQLHSVLLSPTPMITLTLTCIALAIPMVKLWRNPTPTQLVMASAQCSLCFFVFGWHVHEKAILMAVIPLCLISLTNAKYFRLHFVLSVVGHYSLFPLLFTPMEGPLKWALLIFHSLLAYNLMPSFRLKVMDLFAVFGIFAVQFMILALSFFGSNSLPFLPLMLVSGYCAIVVVSCFAASLCL